MSAAISPAPGRVYGVERVCQVWELPRSSYYAQLDETSAEAGPGARRGPKPKLSDTELERLIREDLAASPFLGRRAPEGLGSAQGAAWRAGVAQAGAADHA